LLREIRNAFSHDYPDDPGMQAEVLNKAIEPSTPLLDTLKTVVDFARPYMNKS
jgi:hypothetical protein